MDLEDLRRARRTVTGTKQTEKVVDNGKAMHVFVACDADERVTRPVLESCKRQNIPVTMVDSMEQLGKACSIKVGAAMAAIVPED